MKTKHVAYVGSVQQGSKGQVVVDQLYPDITLHRLNVQRRLRTNSGSFDAYEHLQFARNYIAQRPIDGIFFTRDIGALVSGVLCDELTMIGPSFRSQLICFNKYLMRTVVQSPVKFSVFDPFSVPRSMPDFPYYIKAPYSNIGLLGFTISSQNDFTHALSIVRTELPIMNRPFRQLFNTYARDIFPQSMHDIMLAEEVISGPQVTIDGFVHNNTIEILAIVDTNFFPNSRMIDNFSIPSRLDESIQSAIKKQCIVDIRATGLNNSFFNVEYAIMNGTPILIEINGRGAFVFKNMYKQSFGYDLTREALSLALGLRPAPAHPIQAVSAQCNIITMHTRRVDTIIHFLDSVENTPIRYFFEPHEAIIQRSEHGTVLGQFELTSNSYSDIALRANLIRERIRR